MYKVLVYDSLGHTATVMNDALSDRCELCCHAEEERFQEEMRARQFDLIFLDPPYASGLMDSALKKINKFDILADGGIIICETDSETALKPLDPPYFIGREYKYGKVKLTVCGKQA